MIYNVMISNKKVTTVEIPKKMTKTKMREMFRQIANQYLKDHFNYVKVEKRRNKDAYIVMSGGRGRFLFTVERQVNIWHRLWAWIKNIFV